ncbi:MAG: glycosyltransferase family 4 protein [Planctomycetaceae bacterium]|nr:glycosyltransferase family 4 protein [Planctomycetaceae bacterium]
MQRIAIITAGGAGMFCGSCMQDNTLARALRMAGTDAVLIPTYTPIRVDEENHSSQRVFLGGINVYLDSRLPGWKFLPPFLKHWLDRPAVIRQLTRFSSSTNAADLGPLTVDLLQGTHGPERTECRELIRFLTDELRPDTILFSNALLSGIIPELRERFLGRILTLLQGDDVFLEGLPEKYRLAALKLMSDNCRRIDGVLTHSQYYANFMQNYLSLPGELFHQIPLTLETDGIPLPAAIGTENDDASSSDQRFRVGYFARLCPEKGADLFLQWIIPVLQQHSHVVASLGGYLPAQHRLWFEQRLQAAQRLVTPERLHYFGSPADRAAKFQALSEFDLLFVPSPYREPKGIYVLEAAALGIPSLLPEHGALPERVTQIGSGTLFHPNSSEDAVRQLNRVVSSPRQTNSDRHSLRMSVQQRHSPATTGPVIAAMLADL